MTFQSWSSAHRLIAAAAMVSLTAFGATVHAQDFPARPIRLIAPYVAGASTDFLARTVAQSMSKELGQPVIVENKPGAGGALAAEQVARATPDGYTLLLISAGMVTTNQYLYRNLPYDPVKDFAPLTIAVRMSLVAIVHPSVPVQNVQELLAYARANPGKLTYGTSGIGTSQHMAGELLRSMADISLVHVPYRGGGPAMNDLLAGHVNMMFVNTPSGLPQIKAGKVRAIAVGSDKRDPTLPDVPTFAESGVKDYNSDTWYGFVIPAGVPAPIGQKLYVAIITALKENEQTFTEHGLITVGSTPEEMLKTINIESRKWGAIVKAANIKPE